MSSPCEVHIKELRRDTNQPSLRIGPYSSLLTFLLTITYFSYRVYGINKINADGETSPSASTTWMYLLAELGIFLPKLLNNLFRVLAISGGSQAPRLRYVGNQGPRIDILVVCCGEEVYTVLNTVKGACASHYPSRLLRVFLLDDGGSQKLESAITDMKHDNPKFSNLFYYARKKGPTHNYKAGNQNDGCQYAASLPGGLADFIAFLDADMIPEPGWLRALLPHLLENAEIALATLTQRFYDIPSNDPLLQGMEFLYEVLSPVREASGATWCNGTGYMIRRACLREIGGIPTGVLGEDMCLSNRLMGKGYRSIYVNEGRQHGRVPNSYSAHITQQTRWHVGVVQTAMAMSFYLWGKKSRKMTFRQRTAGLLILFVSLGNIITAAGLIALLAVTLSTQPLVAPSDPDYLRKLKMLVSMLIMVDWLDTYVVSFSTGYRIAMRDSYGNLWIAPYNALGLVRAFLLPSWLGGNAKGFTSSGSIADGIKERDIDGRAPLLRRLRHFLWDNAIALHLAYIVLMGIGILRRISHIPSTCHQQESLTLTHPDGVKSTFLVNIGWPPLLWYIVCVSFAVPVHYAFLPPTVPDQRRLLKEDLLRGADYPTEAAKKGYHHGPGGWFPEWHYTACVVYVVAVGIWSGIA